MFAMDGQLTELFSRGCDHFFDGVKALLENLKTNVCVCVEQLTIL